MRNMLGIVYMADMNMLGMNYLASRSMFIYMGGMLGVFYMGVNHEVVFYMKANKGLVYKAKKHGVKFFMRENEGLVYMAKKHGAAINFVVRQEPCQVEKVLIGDLHQAKPGGGNLVDGALHSLTVFEVSDTYAHNLITAWSPGS